MSASLPTETVASVLRELDAACPCRKDTIHYPCRNLTCECWGAAPHECQWPGHALAHKLARAVRDEASVAANSDAGCAARTEGISEYERGRIDASKDVAALPIEGEEE